MDVYLTQSLQDTFPNEVIRMFFEHLSPEQRSSIKRVSTLFCYLLHTFPKVTYSLESDEADAEIYEGNDARHPKLLHAGDKVKFGSIIKILKKENFSHLRVRGEFISDVEQIKFLKSKNLCGIDAATHANFSFISKLNFEEIRLQELLRDNTSLEELNLNGRNIGLKGIKQLADALETNNTLNTLRLDYNNINDDGAAHLALALRTNRAVTSLDLSCNKIGNKGIDCLALALNINNNLKTLIISNWGRDSINEELSAKLLASALAWNRALTELDLCNQGINNEGATELASALKINTTLKKLNLTQNKVGIKGATALASALKTNTNLIKLNLTENQVGTEGAIELALALENNNTLKELSLAHNQVGNHAVSTLVSALKCNTTLTSLCLSDNNIEDQGATELISSLKDNGSLRQLIFFRNATTEKIQTELSTLSLEKRKIFILTLKDYVENIRKQPEIPLTGEFS